jgi:uncharacterized protein with PIN domain
MPQVHLRFYAELNDFLEPKKRGREFVHVFKGRRSVKDLIEALGVPHTEVDLILVNGTSVNFSHIVQPDDRISVYPLFEVFDISPVEKLRPRPLREPRFVLDIHLGRLATYLRLLGFDSLYRNDFTDDQLVDRSVSEKRVLLTQDRGLLKRGPVTHGYCVRASDPRQQLQEVVHRFDLRHSAAPFSRCLRCNALLEPVEKQAVAGGLPAYVRDHFAAFHQCPGCGRIYWPGSHYHSMKRIVKTVLVEPHENSASHSG